MTTKGIIDRIHFLKKWILVECGKRIFQKVDSRVCDILCPKDSKNCGGAVLAFYKFSKETCKAYALHRCRWFWVGVTLSVMTAQNL